MKRIAWLLRWIADQIDQPKRGPGAFLYVVCFDRKEVKRCGEAAGSLTVKVDP